VTSPTPPAETSAPALYTTVESDKDIAAASAAYAGSSIIAPIMTAIDRIVQTSQNAGLAQSVTMGSDRVLEPVNWDGQSHQQMWNGVHDQNDPSSGANQGAAWVEIGNVLAELNGDLATAVSATIGGWQGDGGSAARAAVLGLAQWGGQSAQAAQYMGSQLSDQTDGASTAKNAMPEPDSYDAQQVFTQTYTSSVHDTRQLYAANPTDDGTVTEPTEADGLQAASAANAAVAARAEQSEAKRQQAIQVMRTYETTSTGVDESTPVFAPPPDEVNGNSNSGSSYSSTSVSVHSAGYVAPTGATLAPTGGGFVAVGTPGGTVSPTGSPIAGSGGVSTPVGSSGPAGQLLEGGRSVGAFGGAGTPSSAAGSYGPGGAGGAGANGFSRGGGARAGGGIAGAPVPMGGVSGDQARSNRAYGPGLRYGGQGGTGLAGRSGIESPAGRGGAGRGAAGEGAGPRAGGSAAGEGSGPRRAGAAGAGAAGAGAPGRAGASGASGAGGRGTGAKGEEDGEHETPDYLKTIDLFGTTQVVAPAVIGEQ
jgi:hypothetical protein